MLIPLDRKRQELTPAAHAFAGGETQFVVAPAGEGAFCFDKVTVGFVLTPQRAHEGRYGSDRTARMPLEAGMGWVLPAGVEGWCAWDRPSHFLNVGLDASLFTAAGLDPATLRVAAQVSDPLLVQLAITLHESADAADAVGRLYRDTLAAGIVAHLAASFGAATVPGPALAPLDPRLARVIDHIEAHLAEDLTIDRLAGIAALSPFHFAKSFRKATGEPPHRFVLLRRVERAKVLLNTTRLAVAEVAFRVGWENVSHFTHAFRQVTGTTPAAFRAAA